MNLKILEIGMYVGEKCVDNYFYIEHFKKQNKNVKHFLEDVMNKNSRFIAEDKNSLTMGLEAVKDALNKNNLAGEDIDIIIFSSSLPDVLIPPCSMLIHREINGKREALCLDMNANCAGMAVALQVVYNYLLNSNTYKRALIVGCDYANTIVDPNNELCYGHYGDAACAVIVEKTEEDSEILGFNTMVDNGYCNVVRFPKDGFADVIRREQIKKEDFLLWWTPFKSEVVTELGVIQIRKALEECKLSLDDISAICMSQFGFRNNKKIEEELGIDPQKNIYIGDKYGYTGTTSPFIAFYEGVKKGMIKRGDFVLLWTIAMGFEGICTIIHY